MHEDIQLYDAIYDKRVECKALNIPEELGQVNIITISTSDQFSICLFYLNVEIQVYNINIIVFTQGTIYVL